MEIALIHTLVFVVIMLALAVIAALDVSKTRHRRNRYRDESDMAP